MFEEIFEEYVGEILVPFQTPFSFIGLQSACILILHHLTGSLPDDPVDSEHSLEVRTNANLIHLRWVLGFSIWIFFTKTSLWHF